MTFSNIPGVRTLVKDEDYWYWPTLIGEQYTPVFRTAGSYTAPIYNNILEYPCIQASNPNGFFNSWADYYRNGVPLYKYGQGWTGFTLSGKFYHQGFSIYSGSNNGRTQLATQCSTLSFGHVMIELYYNQSTALTDGYICSNYPGGTLKDAYNAGSSDVQLLPGTATNTAMSKWHSFTLTCNKDLSVVGTINRIPFPKIVNKLAVQPDKTIVCGSRWWSDAFGSGWNGSVGSTQLRIDYL